MYARRTITRARTLALCGFAGPALFTALLILQGLLIPDHSHVRTPISALAAWPTGWIQNLNFLIGGILTIAFTYGLHLRVQRTERGNLGFPLLVAGGIGLIVAGVFPWVMVDGVPTETPLHVVGAVTIFLATGLGLLTFSRRLSDDPLWNDLSTYTFVTGIVVLVLFVAFAAFAIEDGTPLHPWAGLIQRVLCAVWFTWFIVLALRLRRVSR
jgi:hypothetical membrane protein